MPEDPYRPIDGPNELQPLLDRMTEAGFITKYGYMDQELAVIFSERGKLTAFSFHQVNLKLGNLTAREWFLLSIIFTEFCPKKSIIDNLES